VSGWLALLAWALAASALHLRGRRRLVAAARAGHEVRGPLSTARLALHGLERSARVEAIDLELRRAALALDDLAGGRGGRSRCERVDVGKLLGEAADAWRALALAHGAVLSVEPGRAWVDGDPLRLAQACGNLVANAVEHGGGSVRVSARAAGARVRIEVADLGPGLPAPVSELVAAARGRRSRRGHGLAIAAAIAQRHGGRLTSVPAARGAHLVLELPAVGADRPRRPAFSRAAMWPAFHRSPPVLSLEPRAKGRPARAAVRPRFVPSSREPRDGRRLPPAPTKDREP
jgi:signal transduction histidine kinase